MRTRNLTMMMMMMMFNSMLNLQNESKSTLCYSTWSSDENSVPPSVSPFVCSCVCHMREL